MKDIKDLTAQEFSAARRIDLAPTGESFVITHIGNFRYAVSIDHGYAYTRPQLIDKYSLIGATYTITKRD